MSKNHAVFCIFLIMTGTYMGAELYFKHESFFYIAFCAIPVFMGIGGILQKCE